METTRPTQCIALTPGEPAGIGPDLCIILAQQPQPCEIIVIADPDLLESRAQLLGLPLKIRLYKSEHPPKKQLPGTITVLPVRLATNVQPGIPDLHNADYVLATIRKATQGCLDRQFCAMVTGPVHKGIINDAGIPFSGHTEYIADITGGHPVMMLATSGLRVALVTTHIPLSAVSQAITRPRLTIVINLLYQELQKRFSLRNPRILVCGLNPHAGENGHLGVEEIEIIEPVLNHLRKQGIDLKGPLPADTLFTPKYLKSADAVLAMYHDQGLPVLKHKGFGRAVNITLGLPMIRTSVDHGTALDLVGAGSADCGSLQLAIKTALQMANNTQ